VEPDLSRSRAILIGNSTYSDPGIPGLAAAASCVTAMAQMLASDLCGWPADRITPLVDVATPSELARRLVAAVKGVQDTVLVYYVGHGMRTSEGQLALALSDAEADPESLPHTAILYEAVAKILRGCPAATKLVILDCCHAELGNKANYQFQSVDLAEAYPVDGLYFIGASKAHEKAKTPRDGKLTYFTGAFLSVLHDGIPAKPPWLQLDQIFVELRGRLQRSNLPEPVEAGTRGAHQFPFARNAAQFDPDRPMTAPAAAAEDATPQLDGAQGENAHGTERSGDSDRLRAMRADMARVEGRIRHSGLPVPERDYHLALLFERRGMSDPARELLRSAAWQEYPEAARIMNFLDENPGAHIIDADQSMWRNAERGDVEAMKSIISFLTRCGARPEAINFSRYAAEEGDIDAMAYLGDALKNQKPWEAEQWYKRAADAGHATAAENLRELALQKRRQARLRQPHTRAMNQHQAKLLVLRAALPKLREHAREACVPVLIKKLGRMTLTRGWILGSRPVPGGWSSKVYIMTEEGTVGTATTDGEGYRLWKPRPLAGKSMDRIEDDAEDIYDNLTEILTAVGIDFPNPLADTQTHSSDVRARR
jgi:hypothetical protein